MIKNKNTIIAMSILVISIVIFIFTYYSYGMSKTSNDNTNIEITIKKGSIWNVGKTLKEKDLIHSNFWFFFYCRASNNTNLMAGDYNLNKTMGTKKIVAILTGKDTNNIDEITITFREGINIRKIAKIIEDNTENKEEEVYYLLQNKEYIEELIDKYWFLTDNILNKDIYYPLEGYLYPETYNFVSTSVTIEEIITKLLDQTEKELEPYKSKIEKSDLSIHELLTLASIVELEAKNNDDRKGVAGVFYNRLEKGMSLGSDVTAYYAAKVDDWSNSLTSEQLYSCTNKYNTRCKTQIGLPIGPIANVSKSSLLAVLEPDKNNYYYFVSDCDGNTYFSKTNEGNLSNKNKLIKEGKWCG